MLSIPFPLPQPVHQRMSLSTTFSISEDTFDLFKLRLRELQQQFLELARLDDKPSNIYQLTINLFPISKSITE
jgi:hypothetical protein